MVARELTLAQQRLDDVALADRRAEPDATAALAKFWDEDELAYRIDPASAEYVVGSLVSTALLLEIVSTSMSADQLRRSLREFAATVPDDPAYGSPFEYPGVASVVDESTPLKLFELAARLERERAETVRAEWPPDELTRHKILRRSFSVQLQAALHPARRPARCLRPRPRQYRPRRRRVASSPRKARAPDEPPPEDLDPASPRRSA